MDWPETMALAAFTAGLMGGVHCAAMCGGITCLLGRPTTDGTKPAAGRRHFILVYNGGRILSYTLAGILAGSVGQAGLILRGAIPVQQVFLFTAALSLCLLALYLAGVTPLVRMLEAVGAVLWRHVQPLAQGLLPVDSIGKALGLGMVWGWLPCGMVYAVLLLALGSGDGIQGGGIMLAFGLGTLPNMLLLGGLIRRMRHALKGRTLRLATAGIIAGVGLYGMVAAVHPHAFAAGGWLCRAAP